jgi:DNA-binding response OmpR family regulator
MFLAMLRPPCRALLYGQEAAALRQPLEQAGCVVAVATDESTAAELKATHRPEVIFASGLAPGAMGRLHRLPPQLDAVYCLLVDRRNLAHAPIQAEYDDFIVLPLDPAEVAARVSLWRWRREQLASDGVLRAGVLVVDLANYRVTVEGAPVTLTYKEYELLCLLLRRRGQVLTRDQILDLIWGPDYYGGSRTVDVHVRRLRTKLPEVADNIATVHGVGYRFDG